MRCLNRWRKLDRAFVPTHYGGIYKCKCGVEYSSDLVDSAEKKEWFRIRLLRLFDVIRMPSGKKNLVAHTWKGKIVHPLLYKFYNYLRLNQFDSKERRREG
ncbi:MAG: hypothetical protein WA125_16575 [Desulfosporosinus sp.]